MRIDVDVLCSRDAMILPGCVNYFKCLLAKACNIEMETWLNWIRVFPASWERRFAVPLSGAIVPALALVDPAVFARKMPCAGDALVVCLAKLLDDSLRIGNVLHVTKCFGLPPKSDDLL